MFWNTITNLIAIIIFAQPGGFVADVNPNLNIISSVESPSVIMVEAEKAVVLGDDRSFLFAKDADVVQPIASITKLMTALVFLDNNPGWEEVYQISSEDRVLGGRLNLYLGERVKVKDIFNTSLIASDNGATLALVHSTGLDEEEFVEEMNIKAKELGLVNTSFVDPIGLSDSNVSTAREVAWLAKTALGDRDITEATSKKEHRFKAVNGRNKVIESTNYLLFDTKKSFKVLGGKTGYTNEAGYCFVGRFRNSDDREFIAAVLGSDGINTRFQETKKIVNWTIDNYIWK